MTKDSMQATKRSQQDPGIAQRYLAGQLSPSEQEEYEQFFIRNPDAVRELEATARLKAGLASLRDSGQLDSLVRAVPTTNRRTAWIAMAASVAIVAVAAGLWRNVRAPDGAALVASAVDLIDASGKPLMIGATYALLRTRATDHDAVVTLPVRPEAIELRVLPESTAPLYVATLSRILPGGAVAESATAGALQAGNDGFVRMYVDSSRIEPGLYALVLSTREDQAGEIPTSTFRLKVLGANTNLDPGSE